MEGTKPPDAWDALGGFEIYVIRRAFSSSTVWFCVAWTLPGHPFPEFCVLEEGGPRTECHPCELAGWLVASDRSSQKSLTFVSLDQFVHVTRLFT